MAEDNSLLWTHFVAAVAQYAGTAIELRVWQKLDGTSGTPLCTDAALDTFGGVDHGDGAVGGSGEALKGCSDPHHGTAQVAPGLPEGWLDGGKVADDELAVWNRGDARKRRELPINPHYVAHGPVDEDRIVRDDDGSQASWSPCRGPFALPAEDAVHHDAFGDRQSRVKVQHAPGKLVTRGDHVEAGALGLGCQSEEILDGTRDKRQ